MAIDLTEKNFHFSLQDRNGFPANRIIVICNIASELFLISKRISGIAYVAITCVFFFSRKKKMTLLVQ